MIPKKIKDATVKALNETGHYDLAKEVQEMDFTELSQNPHQGVGKKFYGGFDTRLGIFICTNKGTPVCVFCAHFVFSPDEAITVKLL